MPTDALGPSLNPDRAQVAALGAAPVPPAPLSDADVLGMRTEIQRLSDEVAYLTRDRARWRDRALQAEARLGLRVGCGGAA